MANPKFYVSVHCATFNQSKYIEDALNGFCMQKTNIPYVCTIKDDASTDGEQEIIRQYLEDHFELDDQEMSYKKETDYAHIIFARHKENKNCYFAVVFLKENHYSQKKDTSLYFKEWRDNVPYMALCEGDDYWTDPLKLQKQVDFLDNHSEYSFCAHDTQVLIQKTGELKYEKFEELNNFPTGYTITLNSKNWVTRPLSLLYRTCVINDTRYQKCLNKIDRVLVYFALRKGFGFLMPDVMAVYRYHEGGVCSGSSYLGFYPKAFAAFKEITEVDPSEESFLYARNYIEQDLWKLLLYRDKNNIKMTESFLWNNYCFGYFVYIHSLSLYKIINNYWTAILEKMSRIFQTQ